MRNVGQRLRVIFLTETEAILQTDSRGRLGLPEARWEALLDPFERSGRSVDLWDTPTHGEQGGSACIQAAKRSEGLAMAADSG